ncbi:MAG: hypothetical protein N2F24_01390, partial [Deltaproteobacteria bacterium]
QQQLKKDLQDFVHHLKTISQQLEATEAKLLGNFYSDKILVSPSTGACAWWNKCPEIWHKEYSIFCRPRGPVNPVLYNSYDR